MFENIRRKLRGFVYTSGIPVNRSRFETSDVVQEGLVQIISQLDESQLRSTNINTAWLRKIAIGQLCKLHRFNLAEKRSSRKENLVDSQTHAGFEELPDNKAMRQEMGLLLLSCVDKLEAAEQEIVRRRLFEKQTVAVVAEAMDCTAHFVKSRYESGIKKLHVLMSDER